MYAIARNERHPDSSNVAIHRIRHRSSTRVIVTSELARLLLVVADGVRPDVLQQEMDAGRAPAMAALRASGGLYQVTSSFPSVTGPAYVPFLMGRHAGSVGLPGLRWFDRSRTIRWSSASARSYAGIDIWQVDHDVARDAPTIFELARPSLSGMSLLGRGATVGNIGRSLMWCVRGAIPHFRGDTLGWRTVERAATLDFLRHFAKSRPRFSILAITSPDKFSHKLGCDSEPVRNAIADVDAAIGRAIAIASKGGWRDSLRVWVVSDHGHAPVSQHDDLHGWLESQSLRVLAHPRLHTRRPDVALMVGGNAMAHIYLNPAQRTREFWPSLSGKWESLHEALLQRDAIGLLAVSQSENIVRVSSQTGGVAEIRRTQGSGKSCWSYLPQNGDPLELGGELTALDSNAAFEACARTQYPDAIVQLSSLMGAPRTGDIVISAARDWDLRSRFEPVTHVSTHGALLREQMMVPLIIDRPVARAPQRTADVYPSALEVMGLAVPMGLNGRSFL